MSAVLMPKPDEATIANKVAIVEQLRAIVPGEGVIADEDELRAYECDGLSAYRQVPLAVVLPETTAQVSQVLQLCDRPKNQSGSTRCRNIFIGRCTAFDRWHCARTGQV